MPVGHDISGNLVVSVLVIFASAKILAEVFERLHQPGIVGEILAGILVGPSVLAWIKPNAELATLGEIGLMFLLFQVGLEVKTAELVRVGGTATVTAVAGVLVPFFASWAVCALWGRAQIESIFVGAAMTATSVGITAQVLSARGVLSRTASQIILGAAVIDDVLALLVLGVVSGVAHASVNLLELILTPLFAMLFIALVLRWGTRTAEAMLRRFEGRLRIGQESFVLTMIVLFGLAALSQEAGVAAITGAFLAGSVMGDVMPLDVRQQTHGIAELFVPFFLAGIGLSFDPAALASRSTLGFAAVLLVVAVFSKVIGCGLGAAGRGLPVAIRVGLGMIPRGEFCIVAAQIGLRLNVMRPDMYAVVVFIAVATTMLAPPLVHRAFRAEEDGIKFAPSEGQQRYSSRD